MFKFLSTALFFLFLVCIPETIYAHPGDGKAQVHLVSQNATLSSGQTVTVYVKIDSGTNPVNAVQVNILYPANKLDFVSIDALKSAFDIQAENNGGGGIVKMGRGIIKPVSGEQLVATVNFRAQEATRLSELTIAPGSAIVRSIDNVNILGGVEILSGPGGTNQVFFQEVVPTNPQSVAPTSSDSIYSYPTPAEKKSFGDKIVAANAALWEWVMGIFFPSIFGFFGRLLFFK